MGKIREYRESQDWYDMGYMYNEYGSRYNHRNG